MQKILRILSPTGEYKMSFTRAYTDQEIVEAQFPNEKGNEDRIQELRTRYLKRLATVRELQANGYTVRLNLRGIGQVITTDGIHIDIMIGTTGRLMRIVPHGPEKGQTRPLTIEQIGILNDMLKAKYKPH